MVEYHVDFNATFQDRMSNTQFGGNLSVRKPANEKPLFSFGQDESIFKQFSFSPKGWTAPDGTKPILPKDDGYGIMISAMASREFGFGMNLTDAQLGIVNERRLRQKYSDEVAATSIYGNANKSKMTSSPFVFEFEYGIAGQGYWDYNHMALQLEDCADVLKALYPEYDYLFLFNHSSGHDKQRPDGLCASRMTKGFGGAQPKMRPSVIVSADYLGPYDHPMKLIVGSEQLMVFRDSDRGPFWMSDAEREKRKCDKALGTKNKKKLTVAELKKMLADKGLAANGLMSDLQERAKNFNLPVEKEVDQIEEGWVGKPKGMLQVLWERGFIDPAKGWNDYTLNGKKDNFGNIIFATSVKSLTQSLLDFLEEETLLQYHGRLIGVLVDRTPICHPELAGEGIEYCWACSKGFYRRLPLKSKKGKVNFKKSVRQALSQENLKIGTVRLLSAKARSYMLAYLSIDECSGAKDTKTSHQMIEKLVKKWKTHRNVSDLETGFIAGILKSMVKQSNHDN
jgi:hypothetical protein